MKGSKYCPPCSISRILLFLLAIGMGAQTGIAKNLPQKNDDFAVSAVRYPLRKSAPNTTSNIAQPPDQEEKTLIIDAATYTEESPYEVSQTTTLKKLSIEDGAVITAADGMLLTMTVNGVEEPLEAGHYSGKIVLQPTDIIDKTLVYGNSTDSTGTEYRPALYVNGNTIEANTSVSSAITSIKFSSQEKDMFTPHTAANSSPRYDASFAENLSVISENELFNGIMINDSDYSLTNIFMDFTGSGGNDFTGWGAGIAIYGNSNVTIDGFRFIGSGPQRHGLFVGAASSDAAPVVTVKNAFIETVGTGDLAENANAGMSHVPWVLGLETSGQVRTQMIDEYATVSYENSTLLSDGWGVLSTDDVGDPVTYGDYSIILTFKDSTLDFTGTSGYGTYSIGACRNIFDHSVLGGTEYATSPWALTYGMVAANEYSGGEFINGTVVTAKYGVMWHKNQTGSTVVTDSTFTTYGPVFLNKHCYPILSVSHANLHAQNGVIYQLMGSDDPGLGAEYFTELLDKTDAIEAVDEITAGGGSYSRYTANSDTATLFDETVDVTTDAQASFSDMTIFGNFYNSVEGTDDDDLGLLGTNLILNFSNTSIDGIISSSIAYHRAYSFYFAEETDAAGNQIAVNENGYPLEGTWTTSTNFGSTTNSFTPDTDDDGDYIVESTATSYDLYEGVITSANPLYLGQLTNTPSAAVNNGVLVTLKKGSVWTVEGTSYLTSLSLDAHSAIKAPQGYCLTMTLDGVQTALTVGNSYSGDIVLAITASAETKQMAQPVSCTRSSMDTH